MLDGENQVIRDEALRAGPSWESNGSFPSRWNCPKVQPWLYGYDAIAEAEKAVAAQERATDATKGPAKESVVGASIVAPAQL